MKSLKVLLILIFLPSIIFCEIGKVLKIVNLEIEQPYGMAKEGDRLLISDRFTGNIFYLSLKNFEIVEKKKIPFSKPLGIATDDTGLWIVEGKSKKIFHFNIKEDKVDKVLEDLEVEPFGIAYDGINLWVTSRGKFSKIDISDGTLIESFSGLSNSPEGIYFDGKYLWITDRLNDKIYSSNLDGNIFGVLASPAPYPVGLLRDKDILYILDFQEKSLYILDINFNKEPFYLGKKYRRKVSFTESLCNKGPSSDVTGTIFMSIPIEDNHQKFISPLLFTPENFDELKDKWGQKFAVLKNQIPNDKCIELKYSVQIETADLNFFILPEWTGELKDIPAEIIKDYTIDGKKLDLNDNYLKELTKKIIGNEKNPFWIAFKIHKYLHTNLSYERTGGWNKASTVLKRGNGSCSEFTFSFMALARAAGLPARYEAGIVVRGDDGSIDDVYHRWVQVYIPPFGWVPVDSSRGKPATAVDVANSFGSLSNRFFITTHSGGDSEYLGWTYNSNHKYEYKGEAEITFTSEAKWDQLK